MSHLLRSSALCHGGEAPSGSMLRLYLALASSYVSIGQANHTTFSSKPMAFMRLEVADPPWDWHRWD